MNLQPGTRVYLNLPGQSWNGRTGTYNFFWDGPDMYMILVDGTTTDVYGIPLSAEEFCLV